MKIKIGQIVKLKDGRTGKVAYRLENGDYALMSGQGGQITYFREMEISNE